jgi:murein L,D-transpeptidase YafK
MLHKFFKVLLPLLFVAAIPSFAQDDLKTFRNFQFSFNRVSGAYAKFNDSIQRMFRAKGLSYPPKDIYIRSFKAQNELELWARDNSNDEYKLVKSYRICALSGILGPKRWEGDRQVPEGFYFIEDFNPRSDFYLSMLINYPNYSDLLFSNKQKPGGDIYIHGGCSTVGCLPMTNNIIEELYVTCLNAKLSGQVNIPVHIYPTRFTRNGLNFLGREYGMEDEKQKFWVNLKYQYDYFERNHKILPVMYTPDGEYVYGN